MSLVIILVENSYFLDSRAAEFRLGKPIFKKQQPEAQYWHVNIVVVTDCQRHEILGAKAFDSSGFGGQKCSHLFIGFGLWKNNLITFFQLKNEFEIKVKISDFGMARKLKPGDIYIQKTTTKIPFRWQD